MTAPILCESHPTEQTRGCNPLFIALCIVEIEFGY